MDLTFDLTQCPYDYVGDVIGMLGEYGFNTGEASCLGRGVLLNLPEARGPAGRPRHPLECDGGFSLRRFFVEIGPNH
jgi:hypothetical protein